MSKIGVIPFACSFFISGCVSNAAPVAEDYVGHIDLACPDAPPGAFHYSRPVRVIAPFQGNACENSKTAKLAAVEYFSAAFLDKRCGVVSATIADALSFSCDLVYPDQQSTASDAWQLVMTNLAEYKSECETHAAHDCDVETGPVVNVTSFYLELVSESEIPLHDE